MALTGLEEFYDDYPRVEEAFQAVLDESLHPRGPEMLYEMVSNLGLRPGANVLDLGCGEGQQALKLARDFGLAVHGIDPVPGTLRSRVRRSPRPPMRLRNCAGTFVSSLVRRRRSLWATQALI